jgi:hypothetical protein
MSKFPSIIRDLENVRDAIMNGVDDAELARRLAAIARDLDAEVAELEARFDIKARS